MPDNSTYTLSSQLVAAGTAGGCAALFGAPFETTKKRLQSSQKLMWNFSSGANALSSLRELYRGSIAFICSVAPTTVIQAWMQYNFVQYNDGGSLKPSQIALSGGAGAVSSVLVENTILTQQKLRVGPLHAISSLVRQSPSRPFRGFQLLFMRELIFCSCYTNEEAVRGKLGFLGVLGLGALGSLSSHPFDRTATCQQDHELKGPIKAMSRVYREGGWQDFFKGGAFRVGLFTCSMVTIANVKPAVLERMEPRRDDTVYRGPR